VAHFAAQIVRERAQIGLTLAFSPLLAAVCKIAMSRFDSGRRLFRDSRNAVGVGGETAFVADANVSVHARSRSHGGAAFADGSSPRGSWGRHQSVCEAWADPAGCGVRGAVPQCAVQRARRRHGHVPELRAGVGPHCV